MDIKNILSKCDHTLLGQTATWNDIKKLCDEGMKFETASVCIPPCFVKQAKEYVGDKLAICTVIGFPNGYNSTTTKMFETLDAIKAGADEIDMVINIGMLKAGEYAYVQEEIAMLKKVCGNKILKVIIEACLLTDEEKKICCRLVTDAGADFIKTSTGFSTNGATREDVALLVANVGKGVQTKAAGGIKNLQDAQDFIDLGATRLGTSKVVKAVISSNTEDDGKY
ncbi:MAG: deoxyribose-phosphate aldolase [Clostridia bacterium]|nr:deoxyribose-phosphate aldolase [Clostridia bacterium]